MSSRVGLGFGRSVLVGLGALLALFGADSCSRQEPAPGALVLAIQTDMSVPKDVNAIGLYISTGGNVIFQRAETVAPDGRVRFPATLSIVGQKSSGAPVEIRAVAFSNRRAKVVREAITTVPVSRQALLRMPLEWISARASGEVPDSHIWTIKPEDSSSLGSQSLKIHLDRPVGSAPLRPRADVNPWVDIDSGCPLEQTDIGGECVDAHIDSSTLPDYSEEALYGDGGAGAGGFGGCFDTLACFPQLEPPEGEPAPPGPTSTRVDVDQPEVCAITIPEGVPIETINFAVLNPPGSDGACRSEGCFIPLDSGSPSGYVYEPALRRAGEPIPTAPGQVSSGQQARFAKAYCKRILEDRTSLGFVAADVCGAKRAGTRVCGPGEGQTGTVPVNPGAIEDFNTAEQAPSEIEIAGQDVYFVAAGAKVMKQPTDPARGKPEVFDQKTVGDTRVGVYRMATGGGSLLDQAGAYIVRDEALVRGALLSTSLPGTTFEVTAQTGVHSVGISRDSIAWVSYAGGGGAEIWGCSISNCASPNLVHTDTGKISAMVVDKVRAFQLSTTQLMLGVESSSADAGPAVWTMASCELSSDCGTNGPIPFANAGGEPRRIATAANGIYWRTDEPTPTDQVETRIYKAEQTTVGGTFQPTPAIVANVQSAGPFDPNHPPGLAAHTTSNGKTYVFFGTTDGKLYHVPEAGGALEILSQNEAGIEGIAADQTHVYWCARAQDAVRRMPLPGTSGGQPATGGGGNTGGFAVPPGP